MKVAFYITAETPNELHKLVETLSPFLAKLPSSSEDLDRYLDTPSTPRPKVFAPTTVERKVEEELQQLAERKNITPGEPTIGKIGATAKDEIIKVLDQGGTLNTRYTEHCKLLWKRGEIKYDGKEFYL